MDEYWLITLSTQGGQGISVVIEGDPIEWLIKYGDGRALLNQVQISPEQYEQLQKKGYC